MPPGGRNRRLTFENHHQNRIAAYQVNCLVPRDPEIQIVAQNRDYSQSLYQLDYLQKDFRSEASLFLAWWSGDGIWLAAVAILLFARFALVWRERTRVPRNSSPA